MPIGAGRVDEEEEEEVYFKIPDVYNCKCKGPDEAILLKLIHQSLASLSHSSVEQVTLEYISIL